MNIKTALKSVTTKMYIITRNGEILNVNGSIGGVYNENETVKRVEVINNVCDGTPVVTAIRI